MYRTLKIARDQPEDVILTDDGDGHERVAIGVARARRADPPDRHLRAPALKFVVDASAVIELVSSGLEVSSEHQLLAPTLLRSQTLSLLHEAVQRGEMPSAVARELLARIGRMPIRLLGDGLLRRRAWEIADQLGWDSTYNAEYVALTQLQGDTLITLDAVLARSVEGIVATASLDALR